MKIVKSKLSIAIMSIGFVGIIGAISFASLNRAPNLAKPTDGKLTKRFDALAKKLNEADTKEAAKLAPHQNDIEAYLESMKGFLQTPPRDGVFGGERIPTLHGKESTTLPTFEVIQSLEGKMQLRSAVVGLFPSDELKDIADASSDGHTVVNEDKVRLTNVHVLAIVNSESEIASYDWEAGTVAMKKFALAIREKGLDTYTEPVTIDGRPSWIIGKAVHTSVNSCYKCHNNIKKGDPIGYTVALVSSLKPGESSKVQSGE